MQVRLLVLVCAATLFAPAGLAQTVLAPVPVSLAFTWQSGTSIPSSKTLAIKGGTSTAAFTVTVSPSNALWLSATPEAGSLPAALTVRVNPSGLPVGTYTANLQVAANTFATILVPISLTVTAPLPTLNISATSFDFVTPPNPPAAQTLTLVTTGGPISFTAAAQGAAWLTVTPKSGFVLPGLPTTLTLSVDSSAVVPAAVAYIGKLVITASGVPSTNKTQNVTVNLLANAATPTISSLWPSSALINTGPLTLTIRGTGFYKGTTAKVAGQPTPLKTTFISATTMLADLPVELMTTAGALAVVTTNPAPGGDSTASTFTLSSTPVVQAVVSAASFSPGAVSPGELVTLFGRGMGPDTPSTQSVSSDHLSLILQATSVAIDGQNAPMIYVSRDQITVQVPYNVTPGTARAVVVNSNSVISLGTVDIVAVSPGLFTMDGSGLGQAAALTFSQATSTYALNGASAPARAGDIVLLYLTGEGDYATSIANRSGYVIPSTLNPLPEVTPYPTVTIGGAAATVQYAGPTVGGVLGLLQINAVVPDTSTKGAAVPVSVAFPSATTQASVTLVIK